MDPLAEAAMYKSYKKILNNRCALFISHRLGSIKIADEILVIKDGKIEGKGSHNELLKKCDYYRKLYETQKNMYRETKDEKWEYKYEQ
jgi:ABC-type transport system involved in Fe-S cluster assembly fused permease/ATPase subunit